MVWSGKVPKWKKSQRCMMKDSGSSQAGKAAGGDSAYSSGAAETQRLEESGPAVVCCTKGLSMRFWSGWGKR